MTREEAAAVLGVPASASPAPARPTAPAGGPTSATPPRPSPPRPPQDTYGFPVWSDPATACSVCGWGPAREVTFHTVVGLILFWRWGTIRAVLCRECGTTFYHEAQSSTLTKGWWGIIAPLATIFAVSGNRGSLSAVRMLAEPAGRYPGARTLSPVPLRVRASWFTRPLPLIATGIAFTVIAFVAAALLTGTSSPRPPATTPAVPAAPAQPAVRPDGLVGSCWEDLAGGAQVSQVACGTTEDWRGVDEVRTASACPADYVAEDHGWFLCLRPV